MCNTAANLKLTRENAAMAKEIGRLYTENEELRNPPPDSDWHPDSNRDRPSSRDIIKREDIDWPKLQEALNLPSLSTLAIVKGTGSMEGMMDYGHDAPLVPFGDEAPYRIEDLEVGDVAVYQRSTRLIVHRIWEIQQDDEGQKYTFWGDNNPVPDRVIVRDHDLRYLLVVVIY